MLREIWLDTDVNKQVDIEGSDMAARTKMKNAIFSRNAHEL